MYVIKAKAIPPPKAMKILMGWIGRKARMKKESSEARREK